MSDALIAAFRPVADVVATLDLTDAPAAAEALRRAIPADVTDALDHALRAAHGDARALTPRQAAPGLWFGRLAKPGPDTAGCSIDVVDMAGAGAGHTHPRGEVSWCIPLEGDPRFEGVARGWAVCAAGSRHVPAVSGGRMLIAYLIPDGAVVWDPPSA